MFIRGKDVWSSVLGLQQFCEWSGIWEIVSRRSQFMQKIRYSSIWKEI